MRLSASGNEEAFRILYERNYRRVYGAAYRIVGDSGVAEEVAQEAFLALWKSTGRFRAGSRLEPWLLRIATNRAIDRYRTEKRHPSTLEDPDSGLESEAVDIRQLLGGGDEDSDATRLARYRDVERLWRRCADVLTGQQRAAFVLFAIEGRSAAEVGEIMECSASAVRSHASAARERLRAELSEYVSSGNE